MSRPLRELGEVLGTVSAVLDTVQPVADAYAELVASRRAAGRAPHHDDLADLRGYICAVLLEHRHWVAGAGVVVTPGVLADRPRWLEWWWLRGGRPEPLRVNLDETAADFFDYTSAEWYALPAATGGRHAAGPYVDHLCTNQYSVTLTSPVRSDGELVGVVGADVLVSSLEAAVLPTLLAIGPDAALVTADGRVVASASPDLAPGHRVDVARRTTRRVLPRSRRVVGGVGDWLVTAD